MLLFCWVHEVSESEDLNLDNGRSADPVIVVNAAFDPCWNEGLLLQALEFSSEIGTFELNN